MAFTTWSTTDKVTVTLSGGNLTATSSALASGIRGAHPKLTGKIYWETTCTTWTASSSVGGAPGGTPLTPNTAALSVVVIKSTGAISVNNGTASFFLGARANGDIIGHALDLTAGTYWCRVCPAGNWDGNAAHNPATGVGGISLSALGVPPAFDIYPYAFLNTTSEVITANFGATAFSGAVPAGFASGWDDSASVVTNVAATQVGVEAWASGTPRAVLTQVGIEAWAQITPANVVLTQLGLEAWVSVAGVTPFTAQPIAMVLA